MGFLDDIATLIFAGFKGQLHSGVIRRYQASTGLDSYGRPIGSMLLQTKIEGFVDDYSALTRAQAGIPSTDMRVNIFGASLPFAPQIDDFVRIDQNSGSRWYRLRTRIDTDPAEALWQCQAQACEAPQ